jgi:protein TonB
MKFSRSLLWSASIHGLLILLLLIVPLLFHWLVRPRKKELITYIDMQFAAPPSAVAAVAPAPPAPLPPPPSRDIPEPPKIKKPAEIKKSEKKITRPDTPPPPKPMTPEEIRKLLARDLPTTPAPGAVAGNPSELAWYYELVKQRMYQAWTQPGELSGAAGLQTEVSIRVERDGAIIRREMVRSSGNATMDDSVMKAVQSVSRLKPLPEAIPGRFKDITVVFELSGAAR